MDRQLGVRWQRPVAVRARPQDAGQHGPAVARVSLRIAASHIDDLAVCALQLFLPSSMTRASSTPGEPSAHLWARPAGCGATRILTWTTGLQADAPIAGQARRLQGGQNANTHGAA